MEETWRDIPGYEGKYQVSDYGCVMSMDYMHTGKGKVRKPNRICRGYMTIDLWKNGKPKVFLIHRLVWEAFNGNIPDGLQVNHINEDKADNRLANLNLMTPSENNRWGTKRERMVKSRTGYGKPKTVYQYDLQGNFIREWESGCEIRRQLGYSQGNIASCCRGLLGNAYGYVWKYKEITHKESA